ncbi:MerR family transcriptional regulator [Terribacillus saccharophilus]|uniref:MerR family transcriptional regulator n=1 Tax=Terribacillus saccharophilus TaxID=361277 RepID=UPI000BA57B93|nr:MerR family transcriptional regulator [Terribacillus saccharophilus]PAF22483.1 MerR family transcriptional regulator [Terribacillus saccharophilus]
MDEIDYELLGQMAVTIGDAARITDIPIRKLRYWEDKGYIDSVEEKTNTTRRFDYYMIKKIVLMKELLEDGYTVEAASNKAEARLSTLRKVFNERSRKY